MQRVVQTIIILMLIACIPSPGIKAVNPVARSNKTELTDTAGINNYTRLAIMQVSHSSQNVGLMKLYIDSAEMICRSNKTEIPALLHYARAYYFYYTDDFRNASQEGSMALKLAKNTGDHDVFIKTLIFFGRYNIRTGFIDESISNLEQARDMAGKQYKKYLPAIYSSMSSAYKKIGKRAEMQEALQNVIESAEETNNIQYLMEGYFTLGSSYLQNKMDNRKADSLIRISLALAYSANDSARISLSLANLGWNYYLQQRYDSAVVLYNRSLWYSVNTQSHATAANAYGNLGTIYRDIGINNIALKYYKKALAEAELGNDLYSLYWVNEDMSQLYLKSGDTAKAYLSFVKFNSYHDKFLSTESMQGLEDAKIRYEADVQNKEVELLTLRVRTQRILIIGYTCLFVLSVAVLLLLLSRSRLKSKRRISEMNRKISEITQANLRQQMNPHFIFNTLNSIQYYMYQHDKLATNNYLTKFSSLMRKVLENSQHTAIPLRDEIDALKLYLELEKIRFKEKFDYFISIDDEIDIILYKVPTMLIQPYVENSICHGLIPAEDKGIIKIDLKLKKDYISCVIEDNGIGREAAQSRKSHNGNHQSIGTQIVKSRLELVNSLYGSDFKTIYTDLKDEEGRPEGTKVEIHIPLLT